MSQAHVDYIKNSKAIQTEPIPAFSIQLDKNKTAKIYKSKVYKSKILNLSFGEHKSFVITPLMWKKLLKYSSVITSELCLPQHD
jgi:hypothetical protein